VESPAGKFEGNVAQLKSTIDMINQTTGENELKILKARVKVSDATKKMSTKQMAELIRNRQL
jgi:phage shock protein A